MTEGVYVDTSGLYAVFDADDAHHASAGSAWEEILRTEAPLFTSSYVLVELMALLQRRLGIGAVDALAAYVMPWLTVFWVDESTHAQALAGLLAAGRRDLTLVDCAGFVVMRRLGVRRAFTVDRHFGHQGFEVMPAAG